MIYSLHVKSTCASSLAVYRVYIIPCLFWLNPINDICPIHSVPFTRHNVLLLEGTSRLILDRLRLYPNAVHQFNLLLQRRRDYPVLFHRIEAFELLVLDVDFEHRSTSAADVFHGDLFGLK